MRRWIALLGGLLLAGCTGSLLQSKAPPKTVYLLSVPGSAAAGEVSVDLAVREPRVRAGLDTDLIAVLYPDRRLDHIAGARWSGPLDAVVQDLALQAFRTGTPGHSVAAEGSAAASGYWLELDVLDFQAEYPPGDAMPGVHVHLAARVVRAADRRVLGRFDADERAPAAANRVSDIVAAFDQAAGAALDQIVAGTVTTLEAYSKTR